MSNTVEVYKGYSIRSGNPDGSCITTVMLTGFKGPVAVDNWSRSLAAAKEFLDAHIRSEEIKKINPEWQD